MSSELDVTAVKRGMRIEIDGDPYLVVDTHSQSPAARGANTLIKIKVRNLRTRLVTERSFRAGDRVPEPDYERRAAQFLYRQGEEFHFMDQQSYDQLALAEDVIGEGVAYLIDGLECHTVLHNGEVIGLELPHLVELRVVETEPVIPGATAKPQPKAATLETGGVIMVPPYLEAGEIVKVDTREGRFVERVRR